MTKKGQGISINTIIIAAIALAVLVVLFAIFTGRLGLFSKGVEQTTTCDQACKTLNYKNGIAGRDPKDSDPCPNTKYLAGYYYDVAKTQACCCV